MPKYIVETLEVRAEDSIAGEEIWQAWLDPQGDAPLQFPTEADAHGYADRIPGLLGVDLECRVSPVWVEASSTLPILSERGELQRVASDIWSRKRLRP